jgi:class I fructose-bisphosphate aldolase
MGCAAVGATIYYGSEESSRRYRKFQMFSYAHELGMGAFYGATSEILHSKLRAIGLSSSADLTGQANHLGATIEADIKAEAPEKRQLMRLFGKTSKLFTKSYQ